MTHATARPLVSVVTPCFNEEQNIPLLVERVRKVFAGLPDYDYEHIFADNASTDGTLRELKRLAAEDKRIKVIANAKNFGPTKSVFNAVLAAQGDAVAVLAADLQDPPELIAEMLAKWREGNTVVFGIRANRQEQPWLSFLRKVYYRLLKRVSDDELVLDAGDFALFDGSLLPVLRSIQDANPYLRGLLATLGGPVAGVPYAMERRRFGHSKATPFSLYLYALNGFTQHSLFPLRVASFVGIFMAMVCILIALVELVLKFVYWDFTPPGMPTLIIGLFLFSGVQLFLLGFIGEFVGSMFRQLKGMPLVIERERINFTQGRQ